jgi:hypothetical protein
VYYSTTQKNKLIESSYLYISGKPIFSEHETLYVTVAGKHELSSREIETEGLFVEGPWERHQFSTMEPHFACKTQLSSELFLA